ncbi:MAG TPA: indolepyruvate oxidoreductase subunit beta family protein [Rhodocyclaceae bacterium]|nr:indolepyruvate oxidoreductase subunit beta family protein [Rhodocyclaceae bacterium]
MEVSFGKEVEQLRLGAGRTFHGEGILAITKALLQSGVAYVGGYQGAPVSHLLDVMVQAGPYLAELGVHVEACSNEASAAAMLGASIHYPLRGAVTWKSVVGTNVAADALSNLASPGVRGGALIVVGEDYGEGASVIQERTYAFALKSSILLLDPRPELANMVRLVEDGFALSEASNMPAFLQLRVRACHVRGSFACKDNRAPAVSRRQVLDEPAAFDYGRLAHPPATFRQEKLKGEERLPAARRFIVERGLNEVFPGRRADLGLIVQGGLHNALVRALRQLGLADAFGAGEIPLLALNVTYPLVPEQIRDFCADKRAVLVVEEGQPEFIEQELALILRRAAVATPVHGKDLLPMAGEYTVEAMARGLAAFLARHAPDMDLRAGREWLSATDARRAAVAAALAAPLPPRPPQFCVGCPERPVFAALKLAQREVGPVHIAADIGCHAFATFEPFSFGHTILGYGMSLASRAGVSPMMRRRALAIMGDGGFWHNGLLTGVESALFNGDDAVLVILKNGYTSATGTQEIISTPDEAIRAAAPDKHQSLVDRNRTIEDTLRGIGVAWLRTVHSYRVDEMRRTLEEAFTTGYAGLKVIVAEGECQLERQRRVKPWIAGLLKAGKRVERVKYGVDEDVCSGDHACIRLSGCPTLTLKDSSDPLRVDPVATVTEGCVGCGLCGENAHAATLCPSFYRAAVVRNPNAWERMLAAVRNGVIGWLQRADAPAQAGAQAQPVGERRHEGAGLSADATASTSAHPAANGIDDPVCILVAALGGEGGGVLAEWLVEAATAAGFPAQSTSIPGVAQRTGATSYYVEILPVPSAALGGRRPAFSLSPVPGAVDVLAASELLEAARQVANGMADPGRTALITSTHRSLTTFEKMPMGDGRFDADRLLAAARGQSRRLVAFDMEAVTRESGTVPSAVLFGAIAATGRLPFGREVCEAVVHASGRGVEASLRGFARAFDLAAGESRAATMPAAAAAEPDRPTSAAIPDTLPPQVAEFADLGRRRLAGYQDAAYAGLYSERIDRVLAAERAIDPEGRHGWRLTRETARFLALWMAFDDIVRVAGLKAGAARFARVRAEAGAGPDDLLRIVDLFKPGVPEVAGLLPRAWADRLLAWEARRRSRGLPPLARALHVDATSIHGHLALRFLAGLKGLRRRGSRFADEQARIERWLDRIVVLAGEGDWDSAHEVALCGRLVKGYGATHDRGRENLAHLLDYVALPGTVPAVRAARIKAAREAALADEDGRALDRALESQNAPQRAVKPQPVRWVGRRPAAEGGRP